MADGQVRCIYCGSTHIVRKSNQPRLKKYYDAQGQLQTVEVYRYYCRNRACDKGSFTHLPPGLTPYSPYRTETKLLALQMYGWGYSTYRRPGQALGVSSMTVYFWVSAWGHELLPVAALRNGGAWSSPVAWSGSMKNMSWSPKLVVSVVEPTTSRLRK